MYAKMWKVWKYALGSFQDETPKSMMILSVLSDPLSSYNS